jgi:hypothetical protein
MFITRRIFMCGLAAVLSVAPTAALFAQQRDEELETSKVKLNCYGQTLEEVIHEIRTERIYVIEYLEVGVGWDMLGGPAKKTGWYIHPECMIGCCPSKGPYSSREEAEKIYRLKGEKQTREAFSRFGEAPTLSDSAREEMVKKIGAVLDGAVLDETVLYELGI